MHPSPALLAPALALLLPVTASAQGRAIEMAYEVSVAGFNGFVIDLVARFDGDRYIVNTNSYKIGVLRMLTARYGGRNRAWGTLSDEGARPAGGSIAVENRDTLRRWEVRYDGSRVAHEVHDPNYTPKPEHEIADSDKTGSFDPLTAGFHLAFARDACERPIPIFDGRRRIDILVKRVGTEPARDAAIEGARGDAVICEVTSRRVAGEFQAARPETERQPPRPLRAWLAHLDSSNARYIARLEADTGFGTLRGRVTRFRERAFTDEDRAAMGR